MSVLGSFIDQLIADDDLSLDVSAQAEELVEMASFASKFDALFARKVDRFANAGGPQSEEHPSATAFLADRCRMSAGHARRKVALGNAVDRAPRAFTAWSDDRISADQATVLFRAAEAVPDVYLDAEEKLVEIVEGLSVKNTARTLEYWRQSVDGPGEFGMEQQQLRRGLSASRSLNGMVRVDGWLTTPAGEAFLALLDAHMPPTADGDHRTPTQRRHDAFEEIIRDQLDHGENPVRGGEKPHVTVVTDLDGLQGIAGGLHETLNGDVVDVETIRMLACDASISRIVLGPDSEVLDIGRKTRVWTAAQRRAITARDRHCTARGCERPPHWCDIHHEDHWADGGTTSVEKGKLFCRFHHTIEHIKLAARKRLRPR